MQDSNLRWKIFHPTMALHDHSNNPLWQSSIKLFLFTMSYNVSQTILYIEYIFLFVKPLKNKKLANFFYYFDEFLFLLNFFQIMYSKLISLVLQVDYISLNMLLYFLSSCFYRTVYFLISEKYFCNVFNVISEFSQNLSSISNSSWSL